MKFPSKLEQVGNTLYLCGKKPEDHPGGKHFGEGLCWISFPGGAELANEIAKRWLIGGLVRTEEIHVPKKGWVLRLRNSGYDDDDIIAISNALIAQGAKTAVCSAKRSDGARCDIGPHSNNVAHMSDTGQTWWDA